MIPVVRKSVQNLGATKDWPFVLACDSTHNLPICSALNPIAVGCKRMIMRNIYSMLETRISAYE